MICAIFFLMKIIIVISFCSFNSEKLETASRALINENKLKAGTGFIFFFYCLLIFVLFVLKLETFSRNILK